MILLPVICFAQADRLTYQPAQPDKKIIDTNFKLVAAYLVVMTVFDVETTFSIVRNGGHENNPVMKPFVKNGRVATYGYQMALNALIMYVAYEMKGSKHREFNKTWWVLPSVVGTSHGVCGSLNLRYVF